MKDNIKATDPVETGQYVIPGDVLKKFNNLILQYKGTLKNGAFARLRRCGKNGNAHICLICCAFHFPRALPSVKISHFSRYPKAFAEFSVAERWPCIHGCQGRICHYSREIAKSLNFPNSLRGRGCPDAFTKKCRRHRPLYSSLPSRCR